MQWNYRFFKVSALAVAVTLAGCASVNELGKNHGTTLGCMSGALVGAAIGASLGDRNTALKGAAIGMGVGCLSGHLWQKKLKNLELLAKEENMRIQVETLKQSEASEKSKTAKTTEVGLVAQVQDLGVFPSGSAKPTLDGEKKIRKLAQIFASDFDPKGSGVVLVVGHTDATGSAQLNQTLSEERARAVGKYLEDAGVDTSRVYYQGAGASRPISSNDTVQGRSENRRIEIVEVSSEELLKIRIEKERANTAYLKHSATVDNNLSVSRAPVTSATKSATQTAPNKKGSVKIDFGGDQVTDNSHSIVSLVTPKKHFASLISSAYASSVPISSCAFDVPRIGGEVKNLKTGQSLKYATREFMNGMNGRPWSDVVNGHQVVLSPISVLKDDAEATANPVLYVQKDIKNNKSSVSYQTIVNTYDGENAIIYRVFVQGADRPVECVDLALSKLSSSSVGGEIYYKDSQEKLYVTQYNPKSR